MKEKAKRHNKKSGDGLSEAIKGVKDERKERRSGKFEEAASVLPPRLSTICFSSFVCVFCVVFSFLYLLLPLRLG